MQEASRAERREERRKLAKDILKADNAILVREQKKEWDVIVNKHSVENADTLYKEAKRRELKGDIVGAKEALTKLLELTPDDFRVVRRLARLSNSLEAKRILQEGLRRSPENGYLWHGLAELTRENTSLAREYYQKGCQYECVNSYHALGGFSTK